MVRNVRSGNVSDKSVTLKWGEDGTRMQNTEPEVIFVDMEEEERRTTFSYMKEEPTENGGLEYSIKLSLSQELNRLIELFKVKYQEKDSKIELLLDKENVNEAEIGALRFELEHSSQNIAQLSEELENSNLEKRDLKKELQEIGADLEGAKDELDLVKTESGQEMSHLRQELKEAKNKLEVSEIGHALLKSESDEEKTSLKKELKRARTDLEGVRTELTLLKSESGEEKANLEKELKETRASLEELILKKSESEEEKLSTLMLVKSESEKERIRWEQEIMTKEEMIESLASEIQMKSESIDNLQKQHCAVTVEKENITKELELSKTDLTFFKEEAEKRQQEVIYLENVRKEDDKRAQSIVAIVKKITDDKSRIENEHKGCKIERESLEQKIATQAILNQNQVNEIERLQRELKTIEAEQSEGWNSLKKQVQAKSEKVESQLKVIADQQNKIKRFSENEEWFNLVTEEQNQKSKTLIQEKEAKILEKQVQLESLNAEKNALSQKISSFEEEVVTLQTRFDESGLLHLKTLEKKDGEVILLKKQIEDLKIEIQLMEMNKETNDELEKTTSENRELKLKLNELENRVKESGDESKLKLGELNDKIEENEEMKRKLEDLVEKVKVTETALENTKIANLELANELKEHGDNVKISENELKMLEEQVSIYNTNFVEPLFVCFFPIISFNINISF